MQSSGPIPYANPFGTGNRPYLVVRMIGVNGAEGNVNGLVDSGADITQLPIGYASLMGYTGADLEPLTVATAGAAAQLTRARTPCKAYVIGLPSIVLELRPAFSSASPWVLWGRTDFMVTFDISVSERNQHFTLHW